MSDLVFVHRRAGTERILLCGADLEIASGETVLVSGLDATARYGLAMLIAGRHKPRYGVIEAGHVCYGPPDMVTASEADTFVLDAGDNPPTVEFERRLLVPGAAPAVLILCHTPPLIVPTIDRLLSLSGGRFVSANRRPRPATADGTTLFHRLAVTEVRARASAALHQAGAPLGTADLVSEVLVDAELRGHRSHGIALLPTYLRRMAAGGIVAAAEPKLHEKSDTVATIDAGGGFGQVAADRAAAHCGRSAAEQGIAAVAVHNSNHVGMLAAYRMHFQRHRVIGLLLNISGPSVAPPGAQRSTLGSNALCLVVPNPGRDDTEPFCIDMATGVVAAGKVRDALNQEITVPEGWLQDRNGRPTADPAQLDHGGSIPLFGGYKGLCVTLIVELLAGALAAGTVSPNVAKQRKHPNEVMRCAQLFVGFSIEHFGQSVELIGQLLDRLRTAVSDGYDLPPGRPWFPDQQEADHVDRAESDGILVPESVLAELGWPTLADNLVSPSNPQWKDPRTET